ncbi:two-component response regulator ORR29-like [Oryza brachyantha]|uniref:Response regulatory domain-containing protein n=1 Tax=Oryza brachyantha TaxID=4533 RepID=J3LWX5_ORYBR|nr:two-component response regulator ORR29-like [Oryza brachyantha]
MAQGVGNSPDGVFVIIVDEDKCHANYARSLLSSLNFHVIVYTSPVNALLFLENYAQDVAFVLAAVDMNQLSGFQFLEAARGQREDLQVIMMSAETTMPTMTRCVQLGACFLVKKPLTEATVGDLWQHVDLKFLRMEKIRELLQDPGQDTMDVLSYDDQISGGTEADEAEEAEVNSTEAKKNVKSIEVASNERGHGNAKIFDAAEGTMYKTTSKLSADQKVSTYNVQVLPKENEAHFEESKGSSCSGDHVPCKSDAGIGAGLVDYPDSDDDETNKSTST